VRSYELDNHVTSNIVILGCGGVARCVLPMLLKHLPVKPQQISIIDFVDNRHRISEAMELGVQYFLAQITQENLASTLAKHLKPGDLLIDLAWNIDGVDIISWCQEQGVLYLNTSVEEWDPYTDDDIRHPTTRTLYHRHAKLRAYLSKTNQANAPTAIIEHGANPGLVSHFVKVALKDLSSAILKNSQKSIMRTQLEAALAEENFPPGLFN